jgi:hypothetical protein
MLNRTGDGLSVGDRVEVSNEYHWAGGATGVIALPIELVTAVTPDRQGSCRTVAGVRGSVTFYWIDFAEPQLDADGDGPYCGGEVDARYLERCGSRRS